MKRFRTPDGRIVVEFRLEGDRVALHWLDPADEAWSDFGTLMVRGKRLTPADGQAFYDGLDVAYPGSIETVD